MIFGFNNKKCYYCGKKIESVSVSYELLSFCCWKCSVLYEEDIKAIRKATKEIEKTLKNAKGSKDFIIITTKKLATELMGKINDKKLKELK